MNSTASALAAERPEHRADPAECTAPAGPAAVTAAPGAWSGTWWSEIPPTDTARDTGDGSGCEPETVERLLWSADELLGRAIAQMAAPGRPVADAPTLAARLEALRSLNDHIAELCAQTGGTRHAAELARLANQGGGYATGDDGDEGDQHAASAVSAAAYTDQAAQASDTAGRLLAIAACSLLGGRNGPSIAVAGRRF